MAEQTMENLEAPELVGMCAVLDDVNDLVHVAETVRDAGYKKWDCHTPYPVHGLDDAMGLKQSFIPYVTLTAGFIGVAVALGGMTWMNAVDYPLIIGGKPLVSLPSHAPITFELFVLFAGLSTFATMLLACKLFQWHSPLHDAGLMQEVTCNKFVVVLDARDENFSESAAQVLLEKSGAKDIRPLYDTEYYVTYDESETEAVLLKDEQPEEDYKHPEKEAKKGFRFE